METGSERIFEPVRNAGVQMVLVVVSVFMHMKPSRCLAPLRYSEQAHIRGGLAGGGGGMPGMGGEGGGGGGPDGGGGSKGGGTEGGGDRGGGEGGGGEGGGENQSND